MIERLRRPFGRDFLLDTAVSSLEITVPFVRMFSRTNAIKAWARCRRQCRAILELSDETDHQRVQILEEP